VIDDATAMEVEDAFRQGIRPRQGRLVRALNFFAPVIPVIGYASMATFFVAYTFVSYYLSKLW